MSERLIRVGAALSASVIIGLGSVSCGGESDNSDKTLHCKEVDIDPDVGFVLSEYAAWNGAKAKQTFATHGLEVGLVKAIGVTCNQTMTREELNNGAGLVDVSAFEQPCFPISFVPGSVKELLSASPADIPNASNTLFVVCPIDTIAK